MVTLLMLCDHEGKESGRIAATMSVCVGVGFALRCLRVQLKDDLAFQTAS